MWGVLRKRAAENRPKSSNDVPLRLSRNQNYDDVCILLSSDTSYLQKELVQNWLQF